jgi:hypothetical protein
MSKEQEEQLSFDHCSHSMVLIFILLHILHVLQLVTINSYKPKFSNLIRQALVRSLNAANKTLIPLDMISKVGTHNFPYLLQTHKYLVTSFPKLFPPWQSTDPSLLASLARELLDNQGIHTIHDLTDLPFPEIDKMIQHLSRWKPRAADVEEDKDPVPTPTFPYLATRKFKALRSWADYCILCGDAPYPAHFDERAVTRFLNRLTELEEIDRARKDGD